MILALDLLDGYVPQEKEDLEITDTVTCNVLEQLKLKAPDSISQQMEDNIRWIKGAQQNKLVVGSQARTICGCTRWY